MAVLHLLGTSSLLVFRKQDPLYTNFVYKQEVCQRQATADKEEVSCYLGSMILGLPAKMNCRNWAAQIIMNLNLEGSVGDCSLHSMFSSEWKKSS